MPSTHSPLLEAILAAAQRHGLTSDPDHEVGDLQDALRIVWGLLDENARSRAHAAYFIDHAEWSDGAAGS